MSLNMSYEKAKEVQFQLKETLREAKESFWGFPKDERGVTPDIIRFTHAYRLATRAYNNAEKALNTFNDTFEEEFKAEIKADKMKER